MKSKTLVLIGAILVSNLFFTKNMRAQENKQNVITLSISNLALVTPTVYYERVLSDKTSAKMGLYYTGFTISETKMSGLGLIPEFRLYPGEKGAPNGFYLAPFVKYQNYSLKQSELGVDYKASLTGIGGGVCIGGQFGQNFIFDIFFGPSFSSWSWSYEDNSENIFNDFKLGGSGVGLRFGISVGFGI